MAWWVQALEIADENGKGTGRWRMTAKSDEDGGGPFGDLSHDHASAEEAQACETCDEFVSQVSGMPSRKRMAEAEPSAEPRMDGTEAQRLAWRVEALREALREITQMTETDTPTSAIARNALAVDDDNAKR